MVDSFTDAETRPYPPNPRYTVSSDGRVFGVYGHEIRGSTNRPHGGYQRVQLCYGPVIRKDTYVHRMVLETFVGPCPEGLEACHNDGNPLNNRLDNLRWDTKSANAQDTLQHGRHSMAGRTHCKWGHEFTPENTYHVKERDRTRRRCKACCKRKRAAWWARHAA